MNEKKFEMLMDTLKILDFEEIKEKSLRGGIQYVLSHFDRDLSSEQKNQLMSVMRQFIVKRRDKEEIKRIRQRLDEESHRDMIESFQSSRSY